MENKLHPQPAQTVEDVDHAAENGKDQRNDGQRYAAVANQQQGDHNKGIEHLLAHGHDLLEKIPLVDGYMGLENADGKGQRRVHRHDPQQPLGQSNFLRRQLFAEDHIAIG